MPALVGSLRWLRNSAWPRAPGPGGPGDMELGSLKGSVVGEGTTTSGALRGRPPTPLGEAGRTVVRLLLHDEGVRRQMRRRAVGLIVLLAFEALVLVYYSSVQRDFMTSLERKSQDGFYRGLRRTGITIFLVSPIIGLHHYLSGMLLRMLRTALTERLAQLYLVNSVGSGPGPFYRLQFFPDVDSPDQRICDDARDLMRFVLLTTQECAGALMGALSFSVVLYRTSPIILVGTLLYVSLGTVVVGLGFGPRIALLSNKSIQQEASLRCHLVRVHESAESIAFFRGGEDEWQRFWSIFEELLVTIRSTITVVVGLRCFNRSYSLATFAVVPLMVGPGYLRGEREFGTITQTSMAFNVVLGALSMLMTKGESFAGAAVNLRRLHRLVEALELDSARLESSASGGQIALREVANGNVALRLQKVTLRTPLQEATVQRILVQELSLQLREGQSLLVVGASGVGKSSLLRAVARLWSEGEGHIELLGGRSAFFLPQRPYMFQGSLREQLLYPQLQRPSVPDASLEEALRLVGLDYLLQRYCLSEQLDWASVLSLGEQQRVNFARTQLHEGLQLALVDEGTSACDPTSEARLYELLQRTSRSHVSVGHRQALLGYHSHVLWLQRTAGAESDARSGVEAPASWSLMPVKEFVTRHATTAWES